MGAFQIHCSMKSVLQMVCPRSDIVPLMMNITNADLVLRRASTTP